MSRQGSIRRLQEFDVRPNRELGQHFLVDDNLLRIIAAAAELDRRDVALEIGGGLGVLSEHIAPLVAHLHVVEVDRALEPPLRDALAPFDNVTVHFADALELDLRSLVPGPSKVVANLPYGVAATVLLRSLDELPDARLWLAMVQREVAERLAAKPGSKAYGIPSVIAQLSCDVRVVRRVPATVFHPRPNVDSALVLLRRVSPPPAASVVELVHAAFAHRRKALARSLALAERRGQHAERPGPHAERPGPHAEPAGPHAEPPGPDIRARARASLEALGRPPDARAEQLAPRDFEALARSLGAVGRG